MRSGDPSFNHYNSRGDVTGQTDDARSLTYQAAYEAFGRHGDTPSSEEWGSSADRQRANTKDEDPTGLLNEGFRYRCLETGVFMTRDPLGFVDGPNLYTYVVQNPWTYFDPLGLNWAADYIQRPAQESVAWILNQTILRGSETQARAGSTQTNVQHQRDMAGGTVAAVPKGLIGTAEVLGHAGGSPALLTEGGRQWHSEFSSNAQEMRQSVDNFVVAVTGADPSSGGYKISEFLANLGTGLLAIAKVNRLNSGSSNPSMVGEAQDVVANNPATRNRVRLRKKTNEEVEMNQPLNHEGRPVDPNTGQPLRQGEIDVGHRPGNEWRKRKQMHEDQGSTRSQVIDAENDPELYWLEEGINRGQSN